LAQVQAHGTLSATRVGLRTEARRVFEGCDWPAADRDPVRLRRVRDHRTRIPPCATRLLGDCSATWKRPSPRRLPQWRPA